MRSTRRTGLSGRKELSLRQPTLRNLAHRKENMFESHPYRWSTIGSMEHLDTATLEDFKDFHKKFYIPTMLFLVEIAEKPSKRMDRKILWSLSKKAKY
jgi:hypothetical protein